MSSTIERRYAKAELMTIEVARRFRNGATCFIGVGMPGLAGCIARKHHAPKSILIYESGTVGAKPSFAPLSIAADELTNTCDFIVSIPEMFTYWLQGGRIDMAILGAAQIDRFGNLNSTVIGDYLRPSVRLPGAGGAPEIATNAREVIVILRHSPRAMVNTLDFLTTPGDRVTAVVTDLAVLAPDPWTRELMLVSRHPGVTVEEIKEATGWPLQLSHPVHETPEPTVEELAYLREFESRAKAAA